MNMASAWNVRATQFFNFYHPVKGIVDSIKAVGHIDTSLISFSPAIEVHGQITVVV
jgi:hypothetical protein